MSNKAITWARKLPRPLSPPAKFVLVMLADRLNDETGLCCPSIKMLMADTNFCRDAVVRAVKELQTYRLIQVQRTGRGRSNRYTLAVGAEVVRQTDYPASEQVIRQTDYSGDGVVRQTDQVVRQTDPNPKKPKATQILLLKQQPRSRAAPPHSYVQSSEQQRAAENQYTEVPRTDDPDDDWEWVEGTFRYELDTADTIGALRGMMHDPTITTRAHHYSQNRPELERRMNELLANRIATLKRAMRMDWANDSMWQQARQRGWERPENLANHLLERHGVPQTDAERETLQRHWWAIINGDNEGLEMLKERLA